MMNQITGNSTYGCRPQRTVLEDSCGGAQRILAFYERRQTVGFTQPSFFNYSYLHFRRAKRLNVNNRKEINDE